MIRAFLDASVFFSACFSARGASREILLECLRGQVALVISDVVMDEVIDNLAAEAQAPRLLDVLQNFLDTVPFAVVRATERQVLRAAEYTEQKDAPIVAAAKRAKVDYLVSLDRKHLVGVPLVAEQSGLAIVLPDVLLRAIRQA